MTTTSTTSAYPPTSSSNPTMTTGGGGSHGCKRNFKSPEKLQAHTRHEAEKPLKVQLEEGSRWFVSSAMTLSKLATISYDVPAKLQDGPQCGIVAGWMVARSLVTRTAACRNGSDHNSNNNNGSGGVAEQEEEDLVSQLPTLEQVQQTAIDMKYSRRGEMFTAQNLADLINRSFGHYQISAEVVSDASSLLKSLPKLLELLTDPTHHQMVLAVYDCGPDQRPCNLKGHKAHWGVVTGVATFLPPFHVMSSVASTDGHIDNGESGCFVTRGLTPHPFADKSDELRKLFAKSDGNFELIVRQSKSKRLFFFDPEELANSCCNLTELSPDIGAQLLFAQKYIVPPGGIKQGLANKCIIIKRPAQL